MISFLRFILIVGFIAGAVYFGVYTLAYIIAPPTEEIVEKIPSERFRGN
ncbi:MAG: histidine kinase [Gammaproteobacteria bacterium]|nr:histidine kinase [Gammaproteobacteria bacterium]